MRRRRAGRDAVTEEEIAAFREAQHQFGNDNNEIAAFLAEREQLSDHARRIYAGAHQAAVNRLRVVRRHIQQRAVHDGHLPPDPNRRDDRFAYNLEELENPQEFMVCLASWLSVDNSYFTSRIMLWHVFLLLIMNVFCF